MAFFPRTVRALFHPLAWQEPEMAFFEDLANGWGNPAPQDSLSLGGNTSSKGTLAASSRAISSGGSYSEKQLDYSASDFGSFD